MSTKATIAYGEDFHLYHECFDDEAVYLELEKVEFEAKPESVMVRIPMVIWEHIRQFPGMAFDLVDKSDEELRGQAERFVRERLQDLERLRQAGREPGIMRGWGSMSYGSPDAPMEQQIETGLQTLSKQRDHQRRVRARLAQLKEQ